MSPELQIILGIASIFCGVTLIGAGTYGWLGLALRILMWSGAGVYAVGQAVERAAGRLSRAPRTSAD